MLVTLSGIVRLVRLLQLRNASLPMLVTPFPIPIVVKAEQPENAYSPMPVTSSKSVTLVKPEQPENARSPIIPPFITTLFKEDGIESEDPKMLEREIYPDSFLPTYGIVIFVKPEQP